MPTTGREIDRLIILLVVLAFLAHFVYNHISSKRQLQGIVSREKSVTDRVDSLTDELNETKNSLMEWIDNSAMKEPPPDITDQEPAPVSSGFLS